MNRIFVHEMSERKYPYIRNHRKRSRARDNDRVCTGGARLRMSRIWLVLGLVLATTGAVTIFVERKATVRVCHARVRIAGDDLHASARHTLVCFAADLERGRVSRLMAQEPTGY